MQIGSIKLAVPVLCAPMAGITDRPYRQLVRAHGAALATSEMLTADSRLWHTRKSRLRMDWHGEQGTKAVQIAGSDPQQMAEAARLNVDQGAELIDINLGCPAKKVNRRAAGSALMQYPQQIQAIAEAVVNAVSVPVTAKIRTGWSVKQRNGVTIAQLLEQAGIAALTVHGRSRECGYRGEAEYETIRRIKQAVSIPVIANGDIDSPQRARWVMAYTGADAVMIGRAALGRPWLFAQVANYLEKRQATPAPSFEMQHSMLISHVKSLHAFYGETKGVHIARKHVAWFVAPLDPLRQFSKVFNQINDASQQLHDIDRFYLTF